MRFHSIQIDDLPSSQEWWDAFRWVLLVFTLLIMAAIAGSFISYDQVISEGHPWLPFFHCPGCILCGMTRSFCAMSAGMFNEAWRWNHAGPFFYIFGWFWIGGVGVYATRMYKRQKG